jgi:hypothetical protein
MKLRLAFALAVVLFPSGRIFAQTPTLSCRPLDPGGNTFIQPDEKVIGDQVCKVVETQFPNVAPRPATPKPTPNPVAAQVTAATLPPSSPAPAPAMAVPTQVQPEPRDGKVRLLVTDEPKDESIFLAAHASGWHVDGSSSGSVSGSFVNGTGSVNGSSSGYVNGSGGSAGAAYGYSEKGADPRTVEVQADLYKACPSIVVTNNPVRADYVMLFRRQGGKRSQMFIFGGLTGLALSAHSKVDGASVFDRTGDMAYATRERTVEKAIKDVCRHLPNGH